ncbi:MAG TPA: CHAT domain-containing protein [Thermoflexales bacterium]|nr:CHAT domain-containing protein [Thermoflexales bacterium]HQX10999.1 CHAT domain-containing protein [Thermoflexales bacterium]HQY25303.1 CHAT domain-containing protein [Thermoflexales bacterium]HQZ52823.1 CHAT domain-containing protein [Thermoflexales bacterium]HRA54336.1 CHAT domain-containing protein [Thermoflexales bacterium]
MTYINLDLDLVDYDPTDPGAERFNVRSQSPLIDHTLRTEPAVLPAGLRDTFRQLANGALEAEDMIAMGKHLADALFPPNARNLLALCRLRQYGQDDQRLRIRIRVEALALANVPWEFVFVPDPNIPAAEEGIDNFLALDPKISILRRENIPGVPAASLDPLGAGPLRMLVATANPKTQTQLNTPAELRGIRAALGAIPAIAPVYVENATKLGLLTELMRGAHIFHFAGHGIFQEQPGARWGELEGAGALLLVDPAGNEDRWPAPVLRNGISGRGIRLAVLAACEGAKRDSANAWSGVVPSMIKAGIAAVVGMQFTIEDGNAIVFSQIFYAALAAGQPIEAALSEARLAIRAMGATLDWGGPVLYSRVEEGTLFPVAGRLPSPTTPVSGPVINPAGPDPDNRSLRAYLEAHYDDSGFELLLADATDLMSTDPHPERVSLSIIGARNDGVPLQALKIVRWFDQRGLSRFLVRAVRASATGRQFPI